jgi:hypothetical protein
VEIRSNFRAFANSVLYNNIHESVVGLGPCHEYAPVDGITFSHLEWGMQKKHLQPRKDLR